jgi:hypothetical protein
MAPIPIFDAHGNLSVGRLFGGASSSLSIASLAEMHERFVVQFPSSANRQEIWEGWMRHRGELEGTGVPYATLVNGSFTTGKPEPSDVDLCVLMDGDSLSNLDPAKVDVVQKLMNGPACKADYLCDSYPLVVYSFQDPRFALTLTQLTYWTRVFGIDRDDRQKAILLVNERGVV